MFHQRVDQLFVRKHVLDSQDGQKLGLSLLGAQVSWFNMFNQLET